MQKKVIAAGHVCLDITPMFPSSLSVREVQELLIPGKLIRMENADVHTGGAVSNTGLAMKKLGCDVTTLGKTGDDAFGQMIASIFASHGASGLIRDPGSATSYSVVLAIPGIDRIFLHCPGANDTFCAADVPDSVLDGAALMHFGYPPIMKRMYENGGAELRTLFERAKAKGCAVSLDLAAVDPSSDAGKEDWQAILANVLPLTDFFLPSYEELCFMLDRPRYDELNALGGSMTDRISTEEDVIPLVRKCLDLGCAVCVVKCGTRGLIYGTADTGRIETIGVNAGLPVALWANRNGTQPCFRPERVVSGTGCGDTAIAAFLTAMLRGLPPERCAALAAAEGACCVAAVDALSGLKDLDTLARKIDAGWETAE